MANVLEPKQPVILELRWWRGQLLPLGKRNCLRILVEKAEVNDRFFSKLFTKRIRPRP